MRTGIGLNAQINLKSVFDRKIISIPICRRATRFRSSSSRSSVRARSLISVGPDNKGQFEDVEIGIERLHLEQDAGKSMHDQHPTMSYVDLNRSGVALMEIVSKPDLRSSGLKRALTSPSCARLSAILAPATAIWMKVPCVLTSMFRCAVQAANSARVARSRTSTRSALSARPSNMKARRQIAILEDGGVIDQETRLFDPVKAKPVPCAPRKRRMTMRVFPDPDLLPLEFDQAFVDALAAKLPELPDVKKQRLVETLGISVYDASILVTEKAIADVL